LPEATAVQSWRKLLIYANVALAGVVIWTAIPLIERYRREHARPVEKPLRRTPEMDWVDPTKGAQIIQFYVYPNVILAGGKSSLCYGVAQVKEVRLNPPAGDVEPTFNRCLPVSPKQTTTYTLTATDANGKQLQRTTVLYVLSKPAAGRPKREAR
jgi:hypothetical protein